MPPKLPNPSCFVKVTIAGACAMLHLTYLSARGSVTMPSAALVEEMTLLRAAEVMRAAGKTNFVIVERKDYSRRLVSSQYGVETSSVPTGFKTELVIRPIDAAADATGALDAVAIIDALGPLYYEAQPAAKS